MTDIQIIKQRYGIIGASPLIDRAIRIAMQVAATDITVLITGESGVGKENFPKIIHQNSARKHGTYVAVNCGAIPEGTIDSELFGHEKGSFTGATDTRKGYFEQAGGGTIFLDEVAELPLATQVRLLRVLETGEYLRVGSSKVQKTDVRVVAATNVDIPNAVAKGRFREDLYYRLNTVPIHVPPLRERKPDISLLFKKFAIDFSERYKMPAVELDEAAMKMLVDYRFPGNVRQLKNLVEQISIIESERLITREVLERYIPSEVFNNLPVLKTNAHPSQQQDVIFERELIFKFLAEMQKDISDLKNKVAELTNTSRALGANPKNLIFENNSLNVIKTEPYQHNIEDAEYLEDDENDAKEDMLSIPEKERELIIKSIEKNKGKRKFAAQDLGISERTLYRKLKKYGLDS